MTAVFVDDFVDNHESQQKETEMNQAVVLHWVFEIVFIQSTDKKKDVRIGPRKST